MTGDETNKQEYGDYCVSCVLKGIHDCSCLKDPVASNTGKEFEPCEHDPIKMCDPCCVCSKMQIASLESSLEGMEKRNWLLEKELQEQREIEFKNWNQANMDRIELKMNLKTAEDKLAAIERQLYDERDSH